MTSNFESGLTYNEKYEQPQDFATIFWARLNDLKHEIHCQKACKVVYVDNDNNYVNVKILDSDSDGQGNIIDYPIIPNVPIRQPMDSGSAYIRLPVQIGDIGTIEFFDSSVDDVIKQSAYSYSYDEEWHSLSDGLFTNGFLPDNKLFTFDSTAKIILGGKDAVATFKLGSDNNWIMIGNLNVVGDLNVTGNINSTATITATTEVIGNGVSLSTHTHGYTWTDPAGSDNTDPPN